jgi:Zn-dependent protease with chaperone function
VARLWLFPEVPVLVVLIAAVMGGILSSWPLDRAIFPGFPFSRWLRGATLVSVDRVGWLVLVLFFALAMPVGWSGQQLIWAGAFLILAGALTAGVNYKLMRLLRVLRPAGEHISRLVGECSAETGIPVKAVLEFRSPAGYAAALVVQRALLFSTTTVDEHSDEELRAICRHELAHLSEGPAIMLLRVSQLPLTLLPFVFTASFLAWNGAAGIVIPFLIWFLMNRLYARIFIGLEKRADRAAVQNVESPAYASALERLHRRNLMPAVLAAKAQRTHPDLYDRMLAAGVTPDYPRPAAPKESHWFPITGQILSGATMLGWLFYN